MTYVHTHTHTHTHTHACACTHTYTYTKSTSIIFICFAFELFGYKGIERIQSWDYTLSWAIREKERKRLMGRGFGGDEVWWDWIKFLEEGFRKWLKTQFDDVIIIYLFFIFFWGGGGRGGWFWRWAWISVNFRNNYYQERKLYCCIQCELTIKFETFFRNRLLWRPQMWIGAWCQPTATWLVCTLLAEPRCGTRILPGNPFQYTPALSGRIM